MAKIDPVMQMVIWLLIRGSRWRGNKWFLRISEAAERECAVHRDEVLAEHCLGVDARFFREGSPHDGAVRGRHTSLLAPRAPRIGRLFDGFLLQS